MNINFCTVMKGIRELTQRETLVWEDKSDNVMFEYHTEYMGVSICIQFMNYFRHVKIGNKDHVIKTSEKQEFEKMRNEIKQKIKFSKSQLQQQQDENFQRLMEILIDEGTKAV